MIVFPRSWQRKFLVAAMTTLGVASSTLAGEPATGTVPGQAPAQFSLPPQPPPAPIDLVRWSAVQEPGVANQPPSAGLSGGGLPGGGPAGGASGLSGGGLPGGGPAGGVSGLSGGGLPNVTPAGGSSTGGAATPSAGPSAPGTTSVSGAQAAAAQNASDVGQLLNTSSQSSGVETQRRNAIVNDPRIRGYRVGQYVTYGDGGFYFPAREDIDTAVSKFDPSSVREVTVIKGPYSARYGPGFAFLDINTFDSPRYDTPQVHGRTSSSFQTNGNQWNNLQTVQVGAPDWGARVTFDMLTGDAYKAGNGQLIDAGYHSYNVNFAVGADLTENSRIEFKGLRVNQQDVRFPSLFFDINELNTEAYSVRYTLENQPFFSRLVLDSWVNYTAADGDTRPAQKQIFLNQILSTTFSVKNFDAAGHFTGFNPGFLLFDRSSTSFAERSVGYRLAMTWGELKPDKAQLTAGTDLNVIGQGLTENIRVLQAVTGSGPAARGGAPFGPPSDPFSQLLFSQNVGIPNSNSVDPGLFVETALPVTDRWSIKSGGRIDWVGTSSNPRLITGSLDLFGLQEAPGITTPPGTPRQFFDPIQFSSNPLDPELSRHFLLGSGFINSEYKLDEHLTALAGFGYAERAPTLTELYATGPFVSVLQQGLNRLFGDPNLRKERLKQFDLGMNANYENFRGSVTGFYAFINNFITFDQNKAGTGISDVIFTNTDRASLAGGELRAEVDATGWLTPFATVSYVQGEDLTHLDRRRAVTLSSSRRDGTELLTNTNNVLVVRNRDTEPLPGIPPLELVSGFRIHQAVKVPKWSVEFSARSVMGQNDVASSLGELPTPGFTIFNLRGFWQATENVLLIAGVENFGNKTYREHLDPTAGNFFGDPLLRPGTNFYFSTQLTY